MRSCWPPLGQVQLAIALDCVAERHLLGVLTIPRSRRHAAQTVHAIAEPLADRSSSSDGSRGRSPAGAVTVDIDNKADPRLSVIKVSGDSRPGLLTALSSAFRDLGLEVEKATIDGSDGRVADTFYVKQANGGKITESETITNIKRTLEVRLSNQQYGMNLNTSWLSSRVHG